MKWGESVARETGKKFLRLNCLAEDRKIRDYYEREGFIYKGDVDGPRAKASLYEKSLWAIADICSPSSFVEQS